MMEREYFSAPSGAMGWWNVQENDIEMRGKNLKGRVEFTIIANKRREE